MATDDPGADGSDRRGAWLSERRRSNTATVAGLLVLGVALLLTGRIDDLTAWDGAVLAVLAYLVAYLLLTVTVFSTTSDRAIRAWADRNRRGSILQRYVLGTAPGPGASLFFAAVALAVAVVWLPDRGGTNLPTNIRIPVAVTLVVVAWISVVISFAVAYHGDNLLEHGDGLEFPGQKARGWSDYLYFSIGVMTTFGTTDVNVATPAFRRTVTAHAVLAFVFNTVTVAAVVSALLN